MQSIAIYNICYVLRIPILGFSDWDVEEAKVRVCVETVCNSWHASLLSVRHVLWTWGSWLCLRLLQEAVPQTRISRYLLHRSLEVQIPNFGIFQSLCRDEKFTLRDFAILYSALKKTFSATILTRSYNIAFRSWLGWVEQLFHSVLRLSFDSYEDVNIRVSCSL